MARIFACAGFGALCGSSTATAAAMGLIALPEMRRYGYEDSFASGTVAAGGTSGVLIPPSTVLIIYGILTEPSIAKFFALTAYLICLRRPEIAPAGEKFSLRKKSGILLT